MSEDWSAETWSAMPRIRQELIIEAVFAPRPSPEPPPLLFHYTAPETLASMLSTHTIWVTNAAYLNDQGELAYPVEVAHEVLDEHLRTTSDRSVRALLAAVQQTLRSHPDVKDWYIASFTTEGDLLSQWRAYCPRGGYSLGLTGPQLAETLLYGGVGDFRPVVYDREQQTQIITEVITKYAGMWEELSVKYSVLAEGDRILEVAAIIAFVLSQRFVAFKSPAFAEEREWRIIRYFNNDERLHFRERQGLLTPYMILDIADGAGRLPLAEIHTSPLVDVELAKHSAIRLLAQEGYPDPAGLVKTPAYRLRF